MKVRLKSVKELKQLGLIQGSSDSGEWVQVGSKGMFTTFWVTQFGETFEVVPDKSIKESMVKFYPDLFEEVEE
jgi:hypothetical protein